jgi:hypothetical protein
MLLIDKQVDLISAWYIVVYHDENNLVSCVSWLAASFRVNEHTVYDESDSLLIVGSVPAKALFASLFA